MNKKFYQKTWLVVLCCIIFPPLGVALMWIAKKPIKKKFRIVISVFLCLWTLALSYGGEEKNTKSNEEVRKTTKYEKSVMEDKESKDKNSPEDELDMQKERNETVSKENKAKKNNSRKKMKEKKKKLKKESEKSLFPNEDKYIVNNALIRYNESAKYLINKDFIDDLKEISRPLGKANLTVSNGVYFIIRYNDFNGCVFVDYQAETSDDSGLFFVVRDMTKAVNPKTKDEDFEQMWESFKSGTYLNHYDNFFGLKDFDFSFATRVVNEGKTQYSIKSRYYIHGKEE